MEIRDTKRELAGRTGRKEHWEDYRKERNLCSKNLKKVKNEFYKNMFENFEKTHDSKNIYNVARKLLNWGGVGGPQSFLVDGVLVKRPVDLANLQMKFFVEKVNKLIHSLPATNTNPLKWIRDAMYKWKLKGQLPVFTFTELTLLETVKLIGSLGNSTSFGTDNIDALAIKSAAVYLAPPIRHMINVSLMTSKYANKWKLSKLLPLLKSKGPQ